MSSAAAGESDRQLLLARVDELVAVVAAVTRASRTARSGDLSGPPERASEADLIVLWDAMVQDIDYLRALVRALGDEVDELHERLEHAHAALNSAQADASLWVEEAGRLRDHRDAVVRELLAVQQSRWVRLGRVLRTTGWPR